MACHLCNGHVVFLWGLKWRCIFFCALMGKGKNTNLYHIWTSIPLNRIASKERDLKRLMKKVWCGQPLNIQNLSKKLFGLAWQEKCNDENDDKGFLVLVLILPLNYCCKSICANAWYPFCWCCRHAFENEELYSKKNWWKQKMDWLRRYLTAGKNRRRNCIL